MRLIGHLKSEGGAKTLGDYLTSMEVRSMVEPEGDGTWAVWVYNEDQIPAGQAALEEFQKNPSDPKFAQAQAKAAALEQKRRTQEKSRQGRVYDRTSIGAQGSYRPVTISLLLLSVGVTLFTWWAPASQYWLMFSLPEILRGQAWRLITPIFMHLTIIHLLFNMMMLRDLGSFLESHEGAGRLLVMTVVMALLSNFCQYFFKGPGFGGFSGVLYGYFGYLWIRSRVDPNSGLSVSPQWVAMMLAWFVLCWVGLLGSIANWAHTGGLIAGAAWGALPRIGLDRR